MVFSTEDEVLELLSNGEKGQKATQCNAISALRRKSEADPKASRRKKLKAKVAYQLAGIYFSLMSEGKTQKRRARVWWRDYSGSGVLSHNYQYLVRCGNYVSRRGTTTISSGKSNFRPYEGSRQLQYYSLSTAFSTSHGSVGLGI